MSKLSIATELGATAMTRSIDEDERRLRVELAAVFRVAHHLGWNCDTLNHITVRLPNQDALLMNPIGLGWDEITASSLVTANFDGTIISHPGARLAAAGFNFHSGIMKSRSDINCVMHIHESAGVVIGATGGPLPLISQGGCLLTDEVGLHVFEGLAREADEVPRILRDLGAGHTMIMLNHGLLSVGETLGSAFGWMRALVDECRLVERALSSGREIIEVPREVRLHAKRQMNGGPDKPLVDISWRYWLRLATRLDPTFAD